MYITIGGCRVQSGLYRIRYTGDESTAPAKAITGGEQARTERQKLKPFYKQVRPLLADEITIWQRRIHFIAGLVMPHELP